MGGSTNSNNHAKILDVACGSRMFWFDKNHPDAIYMDNRKLQTTLCDGRILNINPDILGDFTNIPFDDNMFYLVVFDPPPFKKSRKRFLDCSKVWGTSR